MKWRKIKPWIVWFIVFIIWNIIIYYIANNVGSFWSWTSYLLGWFTYGLCDLVYNIVKR